jgi:hypothetical protein
VDGVSQASASAGAFDGLAWDIDAIHKAGTSTSDSSIVANQVFQDLTTGVVRTYNNTDNYQQLGSELVVNGDFATDSDWTKQSGWSISGGKANANTTGAAALFQDSGLVVGTPYFFEYTVSNYVSGGVRFEIGTNVFSEDVSSNGVQTGVLIPTNSTDNRPLFRSRGGFNGSIDNISVKQATVILPDSTGGADGTWVNATIGDLQYLPRTDRYYRLDEEDSLTIVDSAGSTPQNGTISNYNASRQTDSYLPKAGGVLTGPVTTSSTFDGRDIAVDGAKLDLIESGATADQTKGDIDLLGIAATTAVNLTSGSKAVEGDLTVGSGISSNIWMVDSDDGNRRIHCNSNNIGFLNASGGWSAYSTDAGLWYCVNGLTVDGSISVSGTVDGRDVAADGSKLDGIAANATVDQTKADIDALGIDASTVNNLTVETAVPVGAVFTDTTYAVGDGGLTERDFTTALKNKVDASPGSVDFGQFGKTTFTEDLNVSTAAAVRWDLEVSKPIEYTHSNTVNPERITVVSGGIYLVNVNVTADNAGSGRISVSTKLYINGVAVPRTHTVSYDRGSNFNGAGKSNNIVTQLNLTAGDYLEVRGQREDADGTTDATTTVAANCEFNISRISAAPATSAITEETSTVSNGNGGSFAFWSGTEAEHALLTIDANTMYYIEEV